LFHGQKVIIVKKRVAGATEEAMGRFVVRAARAAGVSGKVNVLLTSNRELQSLNQRFRGKDLPTDVISFPAAATLPERFAGDIAISAELAASNSKKLGHSAVDEVKILVLHGLLHLAGYDHEHDEGRMARKEQRLRRLLGLPVALIERSHFASNGSMPTPKRQATSGGRGRSKRAKVR
jgi:probable rRNA maturation factor